MIIKYLDPDHAIICKILIDEYELSVERFNIMEELGISFADDHIGLVMSEEVLTSLMIQHSQYWNKTND